jgi:hypothetical protein
VIVLSESNVKSARVRSGCADRLRRERGCGRETFRFLLLELAFAGAALVKDLNDVGCT